MRSWISVCLLFISACSDSNPDEPSETPADAEIAAMFESAEADGFSGAALVTVDGRRALARGYGLANREREIENTTTTAFDVGSLMKDLTAAAIFLLDQRGDLALSDTLGELLPDVPADKADITVLQIVQHAAGFHDYHDTEGDFEPMTREEARARILDQELLFEPGSDNDYSNSGYTLLADIIETVAEVPFTSFVHDELFARANMEQSGFYSEPLWESVDTAVGYGSDRFGDNDPKTWPYTWALVGNGGLVSTVEDLDRWIVALEGGEVLEPATFDKMRGEYLDDGAVSIEDEVVYAGAGAGDFGLGGVAVSIPGRSTRILIASNTYDVFDVEALAEELVLHVLDAE
ncbi:MAG TPA: serine hydrolase [Polyangiaceae bacterium]|nr:serine hydrolase [Polyangiaceae bacterium]